MEQETFNESELNFPSLDSEVSPDTTTGKETEEVKVETQPEIKEPVTEVIKDSTETTEIKESKESDIKISNPPTQYEGESDIQYNLRKQLYDAGQAKAQATSEEEKSELAKHIKNLRKEMALNSNAIPTQSQTKVETTESSTEVNEEQQAREALKKLGYLSKEEVEAMVQNLVATQKTQDEHLQATREFYSLRKDIAGNQAQREVLERFVIDKFNITPQSSKQDLLQAMDMAATYLFPKVDNRSTKADQAADKRDLVNFSSNTTVTPTTNKADEKTSSALKEIGMSMKDMGWDD